MRSCLALPKRSAPFSQNLIPLQELARYSTMASVITCSAALREDGFHIIRFGMFSLVHLESCFVSVLHVSAVAVASVTTSLRCRLVQFQLSNTLTCLALA